GIFEMPILQGRSIKKLNIYSQTHAPLSTPVSASILSGSSSTSFIHCSNGICNVTLMNFDIKDAKHPGQDMEGVFIDIIKSNATCDVPNPPSGCILTEMDKDGFSPLKAILSGDVSLRIKKNNISIHYVNTDLLASGPPDASFTQNATETGLAAAWKFGSSGPEIYDEVIIGMPYNSSYDDSTINITIPVLYDNDFNVVWNISYNTTNQLIGTDYEDYLNTSYKAYLNGTGVNCSTSDSTLSQGLCYKNTTSHLIFIKIPHFSGVGPTVNYGEESGTSTSSTTTTTATTSTTSGGNTGSGSDGGETSSSTSSTTTSTSTTTTIEHIQITNKEKKEEVIGDLSPEDLGVDEINVDDTEVTQLGEKVEKTEKVTQEILDAASDLATDDKAKSAIENIKKALGEGKSIDVKTSIETYEVKSKTTGKTTYVSKVVISFTATEDMENVEIVEVIPKSVAADISEIIFHGAQPEILQSDPIIKWSFDYVKEGETKDLSYTVKNKITEPTHTLAASISEEKGWLTPTKIAGIIILIIATILLIYVERDRFFGRKRPYSFRPK
ncbi:MAG: hypothetical protein J7L08_02275, partial [Candidatus Aenigmarchaeota archaeon]|nr:hypothetical protein [Candidatus Aenigmarchaeota archaeon]